MKHSEFWLLVAIGILSFTVTQFVMQHCAGPEPQLVEYICPENFHKLTEIKGELTIRRCVK